MKQEFRQLYSEVILSFIEVHNCYLEYYEGPNRRKASDLKRALRNSRAKMKELHDLTTTINVQINSREIGIHSQNVIDPKLLPQEFHDWVSKGLGRKNKYATRQRNTS